MPANTNRIFPITPNLGVHGVLLSTAMTNTKAFDGTDTPGTALALVYTAGANGGKVDSINARLSSAAGATASGTSNALLVRAWLNNGSANTSAANNILLGTELLIPATEVAALAVAALSIYQITDIPVLAAGERVYVGITVVPGGTNIALAVSAFGGDF